MHCCGSVETCFELLSSVELWTPWSMYGRVYFQHHIF